MTWRRPSSRECLVGAVSGGTLLGVVVTALDYRRHRIQSHRGGPADSELVVSAAVARLPCEVLPNMDIVVSNHFYHVKNSTQKEEAWRVQELLRGLRRALLPLWFQPAEVMESVETLGRFQSPSTSANNADRLRNVRTVASASAPSPPEGDQTWPDGTTRYMAMTMERRREGGGTRDGLLRAFVDGATQQTIVKCLPSFSPTKHCLSDPTDLAAPYQRTMVSALSLLPQPLPPMRVCCLGVGGGAIPMFLQQYFAPRLQRLDLVDIEPSVLKAAAQYMGLRQLARGCELQTYAQDALRFLQRPEAVTQPYDVVFADTFVGGSIPDHIQSTEFLQHLRSNLSSIGVAVFNLPSHLDQSGDFIDRIKAVFGSDRVFVAKGCGGGNTANCVVMALKRQTHTGLSSRQILRRCDTLQTATGTLPFQLRDQFPWIWNCTL